MSENSPEKPREYGEKIAPEVRTAIVAAIESGRSYDEVAADFNVGRSTVYRFVREHKLAVLGPESALSRNVREMLTRSALRALKDFRRIKDPHKRVMAALRVHKAFGGGGRKRASGTVDLEELFSNPKWEKWHAEAEERERKHEQERQRLADPQQHDFTRSGLLEGSTDYAKYLGKCVHCLQPPEAHRSQLPSAPNSSDGEPPAAAECVDAAPAAPVIETRAPWELTLDEKLKLQRERTAAWEREQAEQNPFAGRLVAGEDGEWHPVHDGSWR